MASEVTNAIGVLKQFTPQPQNVYTKRLDDVPLQWNVGVSRNDNMSNIGHLLGRLSIQAGEQRLQKEKDELSMASALAPLAYSKATDEQKRLLNSVSILSQSGLYNLQDNKYAVAMIDKMKGVTWAHDKNSEYYNNVYLVNPLPKNSEEERKRRSDYMQQALKDSTDIMKSANNPYAFEFGMGEEMFKLNTAHESTFEKDLEKRTMLDARVSLTTLAENETFNKFDLDPKDIAPSIHKVLDQFQLSQTHDPTFNYETFMKLSDIIVKNTGLKGYEEIAKYQLANGHTVADTYDLQVLRHQATQVDKVYGSQAMIDGFTSLEGITDIKKAQAIIDKTQNPYVKEQLRTHIGELIQYNHQAKLRDIERQKAAATTNATTMIKAQIANGYNSAALKAIADGAPTLSANGQAYRVPTNTEEIKQFGGDPEMFGRDGMRYILEELSTENPNRIAIERLASNPVISAYTQRYAKQQFLTNARAWDGVSTQPQIIGELLKINYNAPYALKQMVGNETANQVQLLQVALETRGAENGMKFFQSAIDNYENNKTVIKGDIDPGLSKGTHVSGVYVDTSVNPNIDREVRNLAYLHRAAGRGVEESIETAQEEIANQYVKVGNSLLPKGTIRLAFGDAYELGARKVNTLINEYANKYFGTSNGVYVEERDGLIFFKKDGSGIIPNGIPKAAFMSEAYGTEEEDKGIIDTVKGWFT